jgi:hypothetical protein
MADAFVGLDLGQLTDPTSLCVVARSLAIDDKTGLPLRNSRTFPLYRFDIMALRRFQLGIAYSSIVCHVVEVLLRPELGMHPRLVLDASGVGNPIVEQFRTALVKHPRIECHAITITGGRSYSVVGRHTYNVAKIELVAAVREALEMQRLKLARRPDGSPIDFADILKRELLNFRVKITASANETFTAREGTHDDLVLSVALPLWLAGMPWMEMDTDGAGVSIRSRESAALKGEQDMLAALEAAEGKAMNLEQEANEQKRQSEWMSPDNPFWWSSV